MTDPVHVELLEQIGSAGEAGTLRSLRDQVHDRMKEALLASPVEQFNEQLNEMHDSVISRAIALAEAEMARMGKGSPPVPYAYLLFGSGGREEQTLSSDQDSGIVYENTVGEEPYVQRYFNELSALIVSYLQTAGYPPCEGEVISSNPEWCKSLSAWEEQINLWFKEPSWEAVRYLLIIADARCIFGSELLMQKFKDIFFTDMLATPIIIRRMLENTMRHKMLLGVFGHLLKEQYGEDAGSLDIKYGAYIPMVNAIRLLSIQRGIRESSTMDRMRRLLEEKELSEQEAKQCEQAFLFILKLRLLSIESSENGWYGNNGKVASRKLTKEMKDQLKKSLRLGKKLQRKVYKTTTGRLV